MLIAGILSIGLVQLGKQLGLVTPGGEEESRRLLRAERPFLTTELRELVHSWEESTVSTEEAKEIMWDIVRSKSFTEHKPSHGIVFVKTHKTASSTISSILRSLSTNHNLSTPYTKHSFGMDLATPAGREKLFNNPSSLGMKSGPYEVLCDHVRFHESLLTQIVPTSGGKYISIVRDPGTRTRSACQYFHCCPAETDEIWSEFILSSDDEELRQMRSMCNLNWTSSNIAGMTSENMNENSLATVESRARHNDLLLLVTERMSESLLLLWDFYKLHPLDMTFHSFKVRRPMAGDETQDRSNGNTLAALERVRALDSYDASLYRFANEELTSKMNALFPTKAMREQAISEFESMNNLAHQVCLKEFKDVASGLNYWCHEKAVDKPKWVHMHLDDFGISAGKADEEA